MSDETNASRPIFVTIVGALYMLLGILTLVGGILVAIGISFGTDDPASSIAAIPAIVVAIIAMLIGYGLLKGWKIM
jgi:phosphate/sulfate permease